MPENSKPRNIYYPPGGILIWMIVFVEIFTFMIALAWFVIRRNADTEVFEQSQQLLNKQFGIFNTLFLVTAGYFMANALHKLKQGDNQASGNNINLSILMGLMFLLLKGYEYSDKISLGIGLGYSDFFTYYWLLTGFHFIHVMAGLVIIVSLKFYIKKKHYTSSNYGDVETGAVFWHMCDLIWLMLFPVLYLM